MLSNNIGGSMIINSAVYSGDSQRSGEVGHITLVPGGKRCYCGQSGCVDAYLAATNLSNLTDGNLSAFFKGLKAGEGAFKKAWVVYLDYLDNVKERAARLNTFSNDADYLKTCSCKKESIAAGAALNFIEAFIESI